MDIKKFFEDEELHRSYLSKIVSSKEIQSDAYAIINNIKSSY